MRVHRIRGFMAYSHLIETDEGLYLVDVGYAGHGRRILDRVSLLGRAPDDIRLCVITHAHADHFGALPELLEVADFPVAAHPDHSAVIEDGVFLVSPGRSPYGKTYSAVARRLEARVAIPAVTPVVSLSDGQSLEPWGLGGRVLHTPGHSSGCVSVLLDGHVALVGDLVQGPRVRGVTRIEAPSMAVDPARVLQSWQRLLDEGAETFFPGHGAVFGREQLERRLAQELRRHA